MTFRFQIINRLILVGLTLFTLSTICRILFHSRQVLFDMRYLSAFSDVYHPNDSVNPGFSSFEFEQAKIQEMQLERHYDLTAVLLHWQRLEGIRKTVIYLVDTKIFKEIIVWNNNPQINLTVDQLLTERYLTNDIRIINSKANLKDEAKYRACTAATTRACFYVDDDWQVSHYIKCLIAGFRSDPNILHSVTDSYTFYTNLIWSYFDSSIDLHSGFSWIGCGSVFLREHAHRHLQLLHHFLINDTALMHLSDLFFSIWLNNIPSQMNINLRSQPSPSPNKTLPFSRSSGFAHLQHKSSVLAIRILEHSLRFDRKKTINNKISFPRQQNRRYPYHVKSPSINDDFIFYTNVLPLDIQNRSFNISRDFARGTRRNLPRGANVTYFTSHSTWKAVDGVLSSCWQTNRPIHIGDFFAIDFLRVQTNLTFILTVAHSPTLQRDLDISISFDGLWWISYRSLKGIFVKKKPTSHKNLYIILFDSSQFTSGFRSFRYITFKTVVKSNEHFRVCEVEIVSKKNFSRIMRDFVPL